LYLGDIGTGRYGEGKRNGRMLEKEKDWRGERERAIRETREQRER